MILPGKSPYVLVTSSGPAEPHRILLPNTLPIRLHSEIAAYTEHRQLDVRLSKLSVGQRVRTH